jgi:uncharacterized alkaline shock family protein YloU
MLKALFTAFWVLLVAAMATLLMLLPFGDTLLGHITDVLTVWANNWLYALPFALLLGLSLWLFAVQFRVVDRDTGPSSVVIQIEDGEVRIALAAIETLIHQAATQVRGVKEVKVSFFNRNEALGVYIKAIVTSEGSIPDLTAHLQKAVKDHIMRIAGIGIEEVKIMVENVSSVRQGGRVELR